MVSEFCLTSRSSRPRYARRLNSGVMGGIQIGDAHGWVSQSGNIVSSVPLQVHLRCRRQWPPIVSGSGDNAILFGLAFVPLAVLLTIAFQPCGSLHSAGIAFGCHLKVGLLGGAASASVVSFHPCQCLAV